MITPTTAVCHCISVNDTYEVSLDEILNATLQSETKARCTVDSPCERNAAPVCDAIKSGAVFGGRCVLQYRFHFFKGDSRVLKGFRLLLLFKNRATAPGMVSTFSWAGWCEVNGFYDVDHPRICPASPWAACMTAPCWKQNGEDQDDDVAAERVLCECPVHNSTVRSQEACCCL